MKRILMLLAIAVSISACAVYNTPRGYFYGSPAVYGGYGYYGGPWYGYFLVVIIALGMGTMAATIGDIMVETMAVDIGDSWV